MKIPLKKLRDLGRESAIPLGKIEGDVLVIPVRDYVRHLQTLPRIESQPEIPEPTTIELASNFLTATARWAAAGAPLATPAQYQARTSICEGSGAGTGTIAKCEFWDGSARAGLGKCTAPGCGCTRFKRWMATERCPKGKWEPITTPLTPP